MQRPTHVVSAPRTGTIAWRDSNGRARSGRNGERQIVPARGEPRGSAAQRRVDVAGRLPSIGDRPDDEACPAPCVADRPDAGARGAEPPVDADVAPSIESSPELRLE